MNRRIPAFKSDSERVVGVDTGNSIPLYRGFPFGSSHTTKLPVFVYRTTRNGLRSTVILHCCSRPRVPGTSRKRGHRSSLRLIVT